MILNLSAVPLGAPSIPLSSPSAPGLQQVFRKGTSFDAPGPDDILSGKSKLFLKHKGCQYFSAVTAATLPSYARAETRGDKMAVVQHVMDLLQQKGRRFFRWNAKINNWEQLDDKKIKDKVGHAIRSALAVQTRRATNRSRRPHPPSGDVNNRGAQAGRPGPAPHGGRSEASEDLTHLLSIPIIEIEGTNESL